MGVDGQTKLLGNILLLGSFFNFGTVFFRHSDGGSSGFPAVCGGSFVEKFHLAVYIKVGVFMKKAKVDTYGVDS